MSYYQLNPDKIVQLAAAFIRRAGTSLNYTKLIKLMYLADRRSLIETGMPITGDEMCALPNGPIISYTLNCISGAGDEQWDSFFRKDGYDLVMMRDPGEDLLSPYEMHIVDELHREHLSRNFGAMIEYTHRLPEWRKNNPGRSMRPIYTKDVFEAAGKSREEIDKLLEFARECQEIKNFSDAMLQTAEDERE